MTFATINPESNFVFTRAEMIKKNTFAIVLTIFSATNLAAQIKPAPTPVNSVQVSQSGADVPLETILIEAAKQSGNYGEAFKNLLATENKVFERYGSGGGVKEQMNVESLFLVYESPKDKRVSSEVRSVVKVNGNLIPGSESKSDEFFAELKKEKTLESELKRIQKEGSRYDKTLEISGLTLNKAIILSENLRSYFDFKLAGKENYGGNDVYIVGYRQIRKSPFITFNNSSTANPSEPNLDFRLDVPNALKKNEVFLSGKLWIDAKTFQVRREERHLGVQAETPIPLIESVFEYQPSDYEILVPQRISLTTNEIKKKDGKYIAIKDTRVVFDYSKFKKSNVEVVILDDDK
jgi:hypothetical protein